MATINYRLQQWADEMFIKYDSPERKYIEERVSKFEPSIKKYFGNAVNRVVLFGSYKRDTILPREYDEHSDIDVLVVFEQKEQEFTPETYRNQLVRFADKIYFNTARVKDHPSVVLEMQGIKFDLVPSRIYSGWFNNYYQIPDKDGNWMDTDPLGFSEELTSVNTKYGSIVKPIIRLMKCWNAYNGYPYPSFELEKLIAGMNFRGENLQSGFLYCIDRLSDYGLAVNKAKKVESLKKKRNWIIEYLDRNDQEKAEKVLLRILGVEED